MPAYTHLQRAQPSRLSHHLMAWQELLLRDRGRLHDALRRAKNFRRFAIAHVPREDNKRADRLANLGADASERLGA